MVSSQSEALFGFYKTTEVDQQYKTLQAAGKEVVKLYLRFIFVQ